MLVLSRKVNERIRIGKDITVTLVEIRGDRVRLGFEAPDDVGIVREELTDTFSVLTEAKSVSRNQSLRWQDLMERSMDREKVAAKLMNDEVLLHLRKTGIWVTIKRRDDRRSPLEALEAERAEYLP